MGICLFGAHSLVWLYLGMKEMMGLEYFVRFYESKAYRQFGSYWEELGSFSASERDDKSFESRLRMDQRVVGARLGPLIRAVSDDMGLSPIERETTLPFCCDHVEPQVDIQLTFFAPENRPQNAPEITQSLL